MISEGQGEFECYHKQVKVMAGQISETDRNLSKKYNVVAPAFQMKSNRYPIHPLTYVSLSNL